jgi:hypothetical protein
MCGGAGRSKDVRFKAGYFGGRPKTTLVVAKDLELARRNLGLEDYRFDDSGRGGVIFKKRKYG